MYSQHNLLSAFCYLLILFTDDNSDLSSNYVNNKHLPAGLVILENFVSSDEEQELLSIISWDRAQSGKIHVCKSS